MKRILILALFLLSSCTTVNTQKDTLDSLYSFLFPKPLVQSFDLVMVGDAIVHSSVYLDAYSNGTYDFTDQLELMKPVIEPYDLAFFNMESVLGGTELGLSGYPLFNSPYEFGDAMLDVGFNLVSLVNNHTTDRGKQPLLNTLKYWGDKDVITSGVYLTPTERSTLNISTVNGIKVGFLAYTNSTNIDLPIGNEHMIAYIDLDQMKADVLALQSYVDVLIVSLHIGEEYIDNPTDQQRSVARFLAGLGVNLIIQNHSHAIQPIEWIDDSLVFYALGNFISSQIGTERLIGLTSAITVTKVTIGNVSKIKLQDLKVDLNYTYYDSERRNIKVYPWDEISTQLLPDKAKWEAKYLKIVNAYGAKVSFESVKKD
ncbi:MAG: hypothetical protein FD133_1443 [Erysipelotrichaceae bacterium]|nr:MAG: hypothetical protein FD179_1272 [Erysipelotrichaceae bacterium]TXT17315.1 MAG: hypothetical protein FD133_1443 [Erysipelotrichaceae bacterium]